MTIIVNGIIDTIKKLKEEAKCPFCDKQLEFSAANTHYDRGERFILCCKECKLEFTLTKRVHKKEVKWVLDDVRKYWGSGN